MVLIASTRHSLDVDDADAAGQVDREGLAFGMSSVDTSLVRRATPSNMDWERLQRVIRFGKRMASGDLNVENKS